MLSPRICSRAAEVHSALARLLHRHRGVARLVERVEPAADWPVTGVDHLVAVEVPHDPPDAADVPEAVLVADDRHAGDAFHRLGSL